MDYSLQTVPQSDLGFVELNPHQPSTILFIHGALSSPLEASLVAPYLENYHILIPAIHTNIKEINPRPTFSITGVCSQLATLIQSKAKNGQVYIYGHSLGAHLALNLAILYPDRVLTVIASGIAIVWRFPWYMRAGLLPFLYAQSVLPRTILSKQRQIQVFNAGMRPASDTLAEKWLEQPLEGNWTICKEICESMQNSLKEKPLRVQARTLMVVGTATIGDSIDHLKYVVNEIKEAGGEARGIEIKQGGHPWVLQLPELCAEIIKAWIEGKPLPDGASAIE